MWLYTVRFCPTDVPLVGSTLHRPRAWVDIKNCIPTRQSYAQCDKVCASQDRYYSHYRGAHRKDTQPSVESITSGQLQGHVIRRIVTHTTDIITREQIAKEKCKRFKTVSGTVPKKLKTEHVEDSLIATKQQVQQKIENILDLKKICKVLNVK